MVLAEGEKNRLKAILNGCDAALAGKTTLALIFGEKWRAEFRQQILGIDSLVDAVFPEAYYAPCLTDTLPDYQQRLEEGER